jgi:hypothetical protein
LLGDYLYAHGLVRIAALGNTVAVHDLAELISVCARMRGENEPGDGIVWAATALELGTGALEAPRAAFGALAGDADAALAAHAERLSYAR